MSNKYFENFKSELLYRHRDLRKISLSEWAEDNTYLGKRKFRINKQYAFQKQILDDMHPHLVGIKLSQVGFTEIQLRKAVAFLCKYDGTTLMYTLPDLNMQNQVSSTRLKPMISSSPALEKNVGDTRTGKIFQFGNSFLHCVHAVESNATSVPADFIMNDELDLSDQEIIALFNSRLQNSDFKIKQRFSTPTFVNYGVDADYRLSDQHEYLVKCEHCNHQQAPDYDWKFLDIPGRTDEMEDLIRDINDQNIFDLDLENAKVVCEKCRKPLNLEGQREWVANYPSRTLTRGYRVRPFSTSRMSIPYIILTLNEYRRKQNLRRGVNTVLGRAYEDSAARLGTDDIEAVLIGGKVPDVGKDVPVAIGIDVGLTCNISLGIVKGEIPHVFKMFTVQEHLLKKTVEALFKKYNIVAGGIDRYPYTPLANSVRDNSDDVIAPMDYSGEKTFTKVKSDLKDVDYIHINRTFFIDSVANAIRDKTTSIQGYDGNKKVVVEHLRDMYREVGDDQKARWFKLTGQDHYFHSLVYLFAAVYIEESGFNSEENPNVAFESMVATRPKNYPKPRRLL